MLALGLIRALLILPGVVVHELAHYYFCRLAGAAVHEVVFFRLGDPAGYVSHAPPRRLSLHCLIVAGPLLVNSTLALGLFALAAHQIRVLQPLDQPVGLPGWLSLAVPLWWGLVIALHALPSRGDIEGLWQVVGWHLQRRHLGAVLALPVTGVLGLLCLGRQVWLHWVYAGALGGLAWWAVVGRAGG